MAEACTAALGWMPSRLRERIRDEQRLMPIENPMCARTRISIDFGHACFGCGSKYFNPASNKANRNIYTTIRRRWLWLQWSWLVQCRASCFTVNTIPSIRTSLREFYRKRSSWHAIISLQNWSFMQGEADPPIPTFGLIHPIGRDWCSTWSRPRTKNPTYFVNNVALGF